MAKEQKTMKREEYPFNDYSWQNYLGCMNELSKQSPVSREKAIAQARRMREAVERIMKGDKED